MRQSAVSDIEGVDQKEGEASGIWKETSRHKGAETNGDEQIQVQKSSYLFPFMLRDNIF